MPTDLLLAYRQLLDCGYKQEQAIDALAARFDIDQGTVARCVSRAERAEDKRQAAKQQQQAAKQDNAQRQAA